MIMIEIPKFPKSILSDRSVFENWRIEVLEIINKKIKEESKKMGSDLSYYQHIGFLIKSLKVK